MWPLFSLAAAVSAAPISPACRGTTTPEVNACLNVRLGNADTALNRYYHAAAQRLANENATMAASGLARAERAWLVYRDAECGSLSDYWSTGTIRAGMAIECRVRLTQLRTFTIWRNWLTYPDSTPPILPRPVMDAALSEKGE